MKAKRPAGFLNVDLEIESSKPLDLLAEVLGKALVVLYSGPREGSRHFLSLESMQCCPLNPDAAVQDLCKAIERLPASGRKIWNRASRKTFDIGYELASECRSVQVTLKPETIRRIVTVGATIAFTCYRREDTDMI